MQQSSVGRSVLIGLVLAFAGTLAWRFVQKAPEIAVAWGNAAAEHERRGAAEDARRAEAEKADQIRRAEAKKTQEAQRVGNEDYNEAHCKVTILHTNLVGSNTTEVVTNVRRIDPTLQEHGYWIYFGGGVVRYVTILKTEDCR